MKMTFLSLITVLVLVGGGCAQEAVAPRGEAQNGTSPLEQNSEGIAVGEPAPNTGTEAVVTDTASVKEFTVKGKPFAYDPAQIRVKKGDTVKIHFENTEGFHDLVIDEFNVSTKQIPAGTSDDITFVADKAGTFEYYCSVGKHREMGMVGKLIVE